MIKGIDLFKKHFKNYKKQYILIGGSACDLLMSDTGLNFRATKDLDIVLCSEALTPEFVTHFWSFVKAGGYKILQKSNGSKCFYRFAKPSNNDYPYMLEIFSHDTIILDNPLPGDIVPMTVEDEIVSLSAILLDKDYYEFIKNNTIEVNDVIVTDTKCLIPLKARAWIDLTERKNSGEKIDSKTIKKHKNDILRLTQLLTGSPLNSSPSSITKDITTFVSNMEKETLDLKNLAISGVTKSELLTLLSETFKTT